MTKPSYKTALADSERELADLVAQRKDLDRRIAAVYQTICALANMLEDDIERIRHLRALESYMTYRKPGFAELVRRALRDLPNGTTAIGVKNYIVNTGELELGDYTNPMASIHTTLRRLVDSGEVEEDQNAAGEKIFRLTPDVDKLPAAPRRSYGAPKSLGRVLSVDRDKLPKDIAAAIFGPEKKK